MKKCQDTLNFLESEIEKLEGADGRFKDAEQNLKLAQDKNNCLQEIETLKKNLLDKQKQLQLAEKNYNDAYKNVEHLRHLQREGRAAILAKNLSDGEPCPVCGATHHPNLAIFSELLPTDSDIKNAENNLKILDRQKNKSATEFSAVEEKIKLNQTALEKFAEVLNLADAQKNFDTAKLEKQKLEEDRKRLKAGKVKTEEESNKFEQIKAESDKKSKAVENLRGVVAEKKNQIPPEYADNTEKISADLRENQNLLKDLNAAWKKIDAEFNKLQLEKSAQDALIKNETANLNELSAKIEGKDKPEIETLKKISQSAQEVYDKSISDKAECQANLKRFTDEKNKFDALENEIETAKKTFELWQHLSDVANGKYKISDSKVTSAKISFRRAYLQSIFRDIVEESNARLDTMSEGRYKFIVPEESLKGAKSSGLDIKIFDAYTGKARITTTLSGGESFLAALSLALGLAAVVKNISGGVKLDTLFIDEGFGSLDSDALDAAVEVLENLQVGGRLVGIISHVDELKQRLPARLEVKKSQRGSTAEFVK